jgi:hypothetical protein
MRFFALFLFGLSCSDVPPDPPPPPTILNATAIDALTGAPVAGARLLLVEQGVWHDLADGTVSLTLEGGEYTVRVEAPGYRSEPRPFRAFPDVLVLAEETNDVAIELQPIDAPTGSGSIAGKVIGPSGGPAVGALVVATGTRIRSTYTDAQGEYVLAGLPADLYSVTSHIGGFASSVRSGVSVASERVQGIDLELSPAGVAAGGRIRSGTGETRVYLVHPDVQEPIPELFVDTNLSSSWQIEGVPAGEYRVETALEIDDGWVLDYQRILRDGPPILTVSETGSASLDLYALPSIKRIAPTEGATVAATPELSWPAVDDADFYVVEVRDPSGRIVFGGFDAAGNPRIRVLPPDVSVEYGGDPLQPGARYEWRVFAGRTDPLNPTAFEIIAASELLDGDFTGAE